MGFLLFLVSQIDMSVLRITLIGLCQVENGIFAFVLVEKDVCFISCQYCDMLVIVQEFTVTGIIIS